MNRKSEILVLDVRSRAEYCHGHLPGAILVETPLPPLAPWQRESLWANLVELTKHLHPDQPLAVYCKKGVRAGMAKNLLHHLGFENVISLGGVETEPLLTLTEKIKLKKC